MTGSAARAIIASTSHAEDLGLIALSDVCAAAAAVGGQYRIIGGHMVRLLTHVYGQVPLTPRLTVDADAGIEEPVAVAGELHEQLVGLGYEARAGNSYIRAPEGFEGAAAVDLLVPAVAGQGPQTLGERAFDSAPGLRLALACEPVVVDVEARLTTGEVLQCAPLVPDLEAAVVMKLLVTRIRTAEKDLLDLATLLDIVASGVQPHAGPWLLDQSEKVKGGERCDAARAAANLRRQSPSVDPRLAALLGKYVAKP